jgi:hypothetical protein
LAEAGIQYYENEPPYYRKVSGGSFFYMSSAILKLEIDGYTELNNLRGLSKVENSLIEKSLLHPWFSFDA